MLILEAAWVGLETGVSSQYVRRDLTLALLSQALPQVLQALAG